MPEEAVVHQLFSLKWFRNKAGHPSAYDITSEDTRLGLISIAYLGSGNLTGDRVTC
jgi:hypothetical protein